MQTRFDWRHDMDDEQAMLELWSLEYHRRLWRIKNLVSAALVFASMAIIVVVFYTQPDGLHNPWVNVGIQLCQLGSVALFIVLAWKNRRDHATRAYYATYRALRTPQHEATISRLVPQSEKTLKRW